MKFKESRDKTDPINIFIHHCLTATPSFKTISLGRLFLNQDHHRLRIKRVIALASSLNRCPIILIILVVSIADLRLWEQLSCGQGR